ncbi:ATP-binding protein [Streptomyces sp. NPDC001530]|uniref:ATP-binding protein n=1 Tax=Streptomyces sp. NPDC001530 TaxID=3364582 RepID=UPI0036A2FDC6
MSGEPTWEDSNSRFLSAALAWLRLLLERQAQGPEGESERDVRVVEIAEAAAAMDKAEAATDPAPALTVLAHRLGLTRFERDTLLLCAAMELDTRIAALCGSAHGDPARPYPTFALALVLFDDPDWIAVTAGGSLRRWGLVEPVRQGAEPLTTSPLRADERIVSYLKGLNLLDDRLVRLLDPVEQPGAGAALPPSQRAAVDEIITQVVRADRHGPLPVVQLIGPDGPSKRLIAQHAAHELGLRLCRLQGRLLPGNLAELETLGRLWERESTLLPLALFLDTGGFEPASGDGQSLSLDRFLASATGLLFLDTAVGGASDGRRALTIEVTKPTATEQRTEWAGALATQAGGEPDLLAGQFDLNLDDIRRIAADTDADERGSPAEHADRLWTACLRVTRPQLDALAQRVDPKATWSDIVLPPEDLDLLRRLAGQAGRRSTVYDTWGFRQIMNRGFGITALFAGPSGAGKTMAAEVLANHLRLSLFRVDLSAIVSKYIGETEKNVRLVFDQMEAGGALLLFDEADALFGKRTEVKDSHDRYANIEVNYLLQRMEAYRGLAILATNAKNALDTAFVRRLRFIIDFPFPDGVLRERIWARAFPERTPLAADLDLDRLARLKLSGGSIHNVALNAAFAAAEAGSAVTMPLLLQAARAEFRKLELPIRETDFHWPTSTERVA